MREHWALKKIPLLCSLNTADISTAKLSASLNCNSDRTFANVIIIIIIIIIIKDFSYDFHKEFRLDKWAKIALEKRNYFTHKNLKIIHKIPVQRTGKALDKGATETAILDTAHILREVLV